MLRKNIFSILLALVILWISLAGSDNFNKVPLLNIPGFDKIAHAGMYFVLMTLIVIENRKTMEGAGSLFLISLIPFCYGGLMEILQLFLTSSRMGSIGDLLSNLTGIMISVCLFVLLRKIRKPAIR